MLNPPRRHKSPVGVLGHDPFRVIFLQRLAVCLVALCALTALTLAAVLARSPTAQPLAAPAKDTSPPRLDRFGETLPTGAVNRIGSTLFRSGGYASRLMFTPDGKGLISRDGSSVIHWDAATGKIRWRFALDKSIRDITMSSDGRMLAVLSFAEFAVVETSTGKALIRHAWPVEKGANEIIRVAISPDLGTFARGSDNGKMGLFDAFTGKEKMSIAVGGTFRPQFQPHGAMWFLSDGKAILVAVDRKPGLTVFDTATGKSTGTLAAQEKQLNFRAFSGDCRLMATTFTDFEKPGQPLDVMLWDLATDKLRVTFKHNFDYTLCCAFSPDNSLIAIGGVGREIGVYDTATGKERQRVYMHGFTTALAFTPDGKSLAAACQSGGLKIWDVATGKAVPPLSEHATYLLDLRFVDGGKKLLSLAEGVYWWDVKTAQLARHLPEEHWYGLNSSLHGQSVSADGTMLAVPLRNDDVALIDTATGKAVRNLTGHKRTLPEGDFEWATTFSSDGTKFFSVTHYDPHVLVWDVAKGKVLHALQSYSGGADRLASSPNGRWLATAAGRFSEQEDFDIRLWDVESGKLMHQWKSRAGSTNDMVFSADSSQLVAAAEEGVQTWDIAKGQPGRAFVGDKIRFWSVAMTADGRMVATNGQNATICLWEVGTGMVRGRVAGHKEGILSMAFSPDGSFLAASSRDAPVYIWDVYGRETTKPPAAVLGKQERDSLWQLLADTDSAVSFKAICELIVRPTEAVPLLEAGWKQSPRVAANQIEKWVEDLDSDKFAVRTSATKELERFVTGHEELLGKALEKTRSLETRRRLENILARLNPERLRRSRMLEVIEQIGNAQARELLKTLVNQSEDAQLSREAAAGLKRFGQR